MNFRRLLSTFLLAAAPLTAACTGTPSPLAPSIHGSIGYPHAGMITNAVPIPLKGDGYVLLRKNGVNWGNPRLVSAIRDSAKDVAHARPGAPLIVGDLAARWGGESSGHRSHRTGRDADLLIYVVTPDGRSVPTPGFLRFGPDGLADATPPEKGGKSKGSGQFLRLDVERQWLLIKALVSSKEANVQWLFFAHWLEALVIEYARARGEDPELIWYAESVLLQPGDSASHDDHLHLRIACTPDEAVAGCLGGGPYWPWLPRLPQLVSPPDDDLARSIIDDLLPGPAGGGVAGAP